VGIWREALEHVSTIAERRPGVIRSGPASAPGDYGSRPAGGGDRAVAGGRMLPLRPLPWP
jgi:hypothetical protein